MTEPGWKRQMQRRLTCRIIIVFIVEQDMLGNAFAMMNKKLIEKYPDCCYSCKFRKSIKTYFGTRHYCKRQRGETKYGIRCIKGIMTLKCGFYHIIEE